VPLLQSWAFELLTKGTLGFSDFHYPQTVQHFVLASFPHSFYNFLLILAFFLCTFGVLRFFSSSRKRMNRNFSELSRFLRMDNRRIVKQARVSALPGQAFFWSFLSPVIFIGLMLFEAKFGIPGLGNTIKTAFELNDLPLLYGSSVCAFGFILIINLFFLALKKILPHK